MRWQGTALTDLPASATHRRDAQLLRSLLGSSAWTIGIRQAGNVLAFGYTILLARWLGADGYGVYNAVMALGALGALVVGGGIPTLLVRRLAAGQSGSAVRESASMAHGLVQSSTLVAVGIVGTVMAAAWLFGVGFEAPQDGGAGGSALLLAGGLVVLLYLLNVHQSILLALGWHVLASVVGFLARPLSFAVLLAFCLLLVKPDSVVVVLVLQLGAAALTVVLGAVLVARVLPFRGKPPLTRDLFACYREALPFLWSRLGRALWGRTEVAWLMFAVSAEASGHYAVGLVFSAALANVAEVQSRTLAPLAARSDSPLATVVPRFTRRCCLLVAPVVVGLWVAGDVCLSWFGPSYADALLTMQLLATTQLLTLAFGPSATILSMRHQQQLVARSALVGAGFLGLCVVVLGSQYGAFGCAVAHMLASVAWSAWLWWRLMRIEGLRADVLA